MLPKHLKDSTFSRCFWSIIIFTRPKTTRECGIFSLVVLGLVKIMIDQKQQTNTKANSKLIQRPTEYAVSETKWR
jgi:hypothetical protein